MLLRDRKILSGAAPLECLLRIERILFFLRVGDKMHGGRIKGRNVCVMEILFGRPIALGQGQVRFILRRIASLNIF